LALFFNIFASFPVVRRMNKRWLVLLLGALLLTGPSCSQTEEVPAPAKKDPGGEGPGLSETDPDPDLQGPDLLKDMTSTSGVKFTYRNGEARNHLAILESLGGGVALLDYDGDGRLDIFVPGGGYFGGPDHKQIQGYPCKLYRNLGNWKFKDVTHEVGLDRLAGGQPWFYSHAAAVGDFDRDGWPDLLVTGWGRVALFHNVPDGKGGRRFVDVSSQAGLDRGITWASSAAWADLDGDGWPDLYVCQYANWSFANHPKCFYHDPNVPDVCPPKNFQGLPHKLFHNQPDGKGGRRFVDVSGPAGLHKGGDANSKGLGVLIVDVNFDGKPDIFVANDTVPKFLYVNHSEPGKIRFKEEADQAGVALDNNGDPNGSMGVDAGDPDGSGRPALWVTNYEHELHGLYLNLCKKNQVLFSFHTEAAGIAAIGQKYVGWGTGFVDLDHHGWEDLVIVNGHAIRYPKDAPRRQKPVLLRNEAGRFKDITPRGGPYFRQDHLARGLALGDLDNDGKVDLVISHVNDPVALLRNVAPDRGHWLGIDLVGKDFADVVGARVLVEAGGRKQTRFAKGGGSYASSPDRRLVFGLGKSNRVDKLTVIWRDGSRRSWDHVPVDRYHVLVQGTAELLNARPHR
jgi:hypothetical protein